VSWDRDEEIRPVRPSCSTGFEEGGVELAIQMVRLPLLLWLYATRMMATTLEGMSRMSEEAVGTVARQIERPARVQAAALPVEICASRRSAENQKEKRVMSDTNLNDKMVKLVEYTIVSIQRGKEKVLAQPQQVVETDDLTGDAFSNSRIAEWVKSNPEEAKKFDLEDVRVYYNVVGRWPKRDLKYDEKTLEYDERKTQLLGDIVEQLKHLGETA
jgi:hypothetical protein